MRGVTDLDDLANELLTTVGTALLTTAGGAIDRAYVSPGVPVIDCCPMLTVDVRTLTAENTAPTGPSPVIGHRGVRVPALWLVSLVITVVRCAATVEEQQLPSIADLTANATAMNEDLWAIWNWLLEAKRDGLLFDGACTAMYLDPPLSINQGGCCGWTLQIRVPVNGYAAPVGT